MQVRVLCPTPRMVQHADIRGASRIEPGNARSIGGPTLIASYADARDVHLGRPLGLVEHGAGQTYMDVEHQGYAGGPGWDRLDIVLVPGPHAALAWLSSYPRVQVVQVGRPAHRPYLGNHAYVGVTFHWPCRKTIESGTAFYDWQAEVARTAQVLPLLGHWHPKWDEPRSNWNPVRQLWRDLDIPHTPDVEDVFALCDVLVVDNSSLAYEFAATHRPVVSLNAETWRKGVEHGLRFWSLIPGRVLDPGADLAAAVTDARAGHGDAARDRAVAAVYGGHHDDGLHALTAWVRTHDHG